MQYNEGKEQSFYRPYQDIFLQMDDCLVKKDYIAYINLVEMLEDMSILSLTTEEFSLIRQIRRLMRAYVEQLNQAKTDKIEAQTIIRQDKERNVAQEQQWIRQYYIEYPLNRIIKRICIHSLKRTVLKTQTPAGGTTYIIDKDVQATVEDLNYYLQNYGVKIPEEANKWAAKN